MKDSQIKTQHEYTIKLQDKIKSMKETLNGSANGNAKNCFS